MKKLFFLMVGLLLTQNTFSQNTQGKSNDAGRIALKAFVPADMGDLTETAREALKTKLQSVITSNGLGGSSYDDRFVMTAKIVELTKDVSPTTPIIYTYTLEVTLLIGDATSGTLFSSHSFEQKGSGNSETKAYMTALKGIKAKDVQYAKFIDDSKVKIIEYYNSKCDFYLKEAQTLADQSKHQAAIATLISIPEVCKECYDKAMAAVAPIYKKQIDYQCKLDLTEARNLWNTNQDYYGAEQASGFLAKVDPNSSCYAEAQTLSAQMGKRIKEIDQREWNFQLKQQQDDVDIQKATIQSARDIGVAYGNNQPKTVTYNNYSSWWW